MMALLSRGTAALVALAVLAAPVQAQLQMPDPSQIHGRAIPANDLADGTVTVRVVRESIGNNAPGQSVRVTVNGAATTATTDENGRAEFPSLPKGQQGRAEVTVDGEALVSEPFTVPTMGGLRVILIAGIAQAAERKAQEASEALAAPPSKGVVVFGSESRVLMELADNGLQVYYVLNVVNNARTRVDIGGPLIIDLPRGAAGATALEGSSPSATVTGNRVTITGPFAPGTTAVQIAYQLRYDAGTFTLTQAWPAAFTEVAVAVEKVGALTMTSPQLVTTSDVRAGNGTIFLLGTGPGIAAGGTLSVALDGLPYHSATPRRITLSLAVIVVGLGGWLAYTGGRRTRPDRQTLLTRRDALLAELQSLEARRRAGQGNRERNDARRQRLLQELEEIYGELDDVAGPPQGGGEGVAA